MTAVKNGFSDGQGHQSTASDNPQTDPLEKDARAAAGRYLDAFEQQVSQWAISGWPGQLKG